MRKASLSCRMLTSIDVEKVDPTKAAVLSLRSGLCSTFAWVTIGYNDICAGARADVQYSTISLSGHSPTRCMTVVTHVLNLSAGHATYDSPYCANVHWTSDSYLSPARTFRVPINFGAHK